MNANEEVGQADDFKGIWVKILFTEIFFDRVTDFVNVRPLFPTSSQGCRVWSRSIMRLVAVFLSGER